MSSSMLALVSCSVLVAAALSAPTHQDRVAVYFTIGANGPRDPINNSMTGSFEIALAEFDKRNGHLLVSKNLTAVNGLDMGYVAVDSRRSRVVFSNQQQWTKEMTYNNVELLTVPLDAEHAATATPFLTPAQTTQLLQICKGDGGQHGCNQMSQFSPHPGASSVLFSVRFWGPFPNGYAVGNQAIAILRDDGTAAALTWNGAYEAQFWEDLCANFVPGTNDRFAVFTRSIDSGTGNTMTVHVLDVESKTITALPGIPDVATETGCPHFVVGQDSAAENATAVTATFIYVSSPLEAASTNVSTTRTNKQRQRHRRPTRKDPSPSSYRPSWPRLVPEGHMELTAVSLTLSGLGDGEGATTTVEANASTWYKIPLVNTIDFSFVPDIFQCSQLVTAPSSDATKTLTPQPPTKETTTLLCETANTQVAVVTPVSGGDGTTYRKLKTFLLPRGAPDDGDAWCITADCFRGFLV